ncbi:hypothetical protein AKJ16_DCAP13229 [Drosera capensis]
MSLPATNSTKTRQHSAPCKENRGKRIKTQEVAHLKAIKLCDGQHSLQHGLHLHANSLAMTRKHENKTCSSMVEGLRTSRHQKYKVDNPVMNSLTYTSITL